MTDDATGRVALVTGANRGLGRAITERLVRDGFRVAGTTRSGEAAAGVFPVYAEMTGPATIDAAFSQVEEQLGPVEVLVCNAGITRDMLLMRMKDDDFADVLDTNLVGAFRAVKRASRQMVRARYGRIVLISSVSAYVGAAGQVNYSASKAGLIGLGRSVARELGGRGITCNIVAPGLIESDMSRQLDEAHRRAYFERIPAGRFGVGDDVAAAVSFLCREEAGYVNGAVLPVDGGLAMGH